jgi:uncharacterized MnhB-related membrane protein
VLAVAALLLGLVAVSAVLSALGDVWSAYIGGWDIALRLLDLLVSFAILTILFALIYQYVPRADIAWSDVWLGAGVTAVLFIIGRYLIGLYLGTAGVGSGVGAAGSLVVLLMWVYYSAQIFLLGAEFTWVYAHRHGSRATHAPPDKDRRPPEALNRPLTGGMKLVGVVAAIGVLSWGRLSVGAEAVTVAFAPTLGLFLRGVAVALGAALAAGIVPAMFAAKSEIVRALRQI